MKVNDVLACEFWPAPLDHIQGTPRALQHLVHTVSPNHTATGKMDEHQCRHLLQRETSKSTFVCLGLRYRWVFHKRQSIHP